MEQNPNPINERQSPKPLIQGTHLLISFTDTEGNVVDNRAFISNEQMENLNVEPPVIVMETLRRMSAELIAHVFPDEISQLPIPARPSAPNEKGNLN